MTKYFNAKVQVVQTRTVHVQVAADSEAAAAELAKAQARLKEPGFSVQDVSLSLVGESDLGLAPVSSTACLARVSLRASTPRESQASSGCKLSLTGVIPNTSTGRARSSDRNAWLSRSRPRWKQSHRLPEKRTSRANESSKNDS